MTFKETIKKLKLRSIRSQLILGVAIVNIILSSIFVLGMINSQRTYFLKLNHDRVMGLSISLASTADSYVISYELARLQKLVSTYKMMPGLEYAFVTSNDGLVLAHTNEKFIGLKTTDAVSAKLQPLNITQVLVEDNNILDIASPIVNHREIVGWARVGISQKFIEPNIAEIKRRGLFYILISLIVGIVFAIIVAGRLSKGLQKLVVVAQKIKEGKRELRADSSKSIEVTELGVAINQMLDTISSNETLLNKVLENMPVGVFILDANGKVLSLNPAAQQIWEGAKYVDYGEYNVYKGWFPNGKEIESHEWGAALALRENKAVLNQEAEIEGFNGNRKTILNSCIPMHDADRKITGVISINVDISDRKKAENELHKKNHAIAERAKELKCLYIMSQLSNDPDKSLLDILKDCADVIPPSYQYPEITCARIEFEGQIFESASFVESKWKQEQNIIGNGAPIGKVQVYYKEQMPDEAEGPFLSEERLLINSIADILGSSAERKKATELFKYQFENSPDLILIVNRNSKIESINRSRSDGPTPEQLIGMDCIEVLPEESRRMASDALKNCFDTGKNQEIENTLHSNRWVRSRFVPIIINGAITKAMIIATDITDQRRAQQQIELEKLLSDSIINSLPGIFYMRDKSGKLLRWNKNAELFFGMNKEEASKLHTLDFVDDSQKELVKESHNEAQQTGISEVIVYLKNSEGKSVPYFFTGRKLNYDADEFVIAVGIDISERIEAEQKLTERTSEIQKLSAHLEKAQEEERTRIAREIHDELGQQLTGLKMDAFVVAKNIEEDKKKATDKVNEMVKLIDFTIKTVRRIASDLRPGVLDDLGLMAAIEWQGQEFEKRTGIKLIFESDLPDLNPERNLSTNVFRVYQEILTNIMRHAKATLIETKLAVIENNIILEVRDNGQGFNFEEIKNKGSLGLVGMKERVLLFNGQLGIDSKKGKGTIISLKVPIIITKN